MNIIFSRIWNAQKNCWVACSEKAKACRKTGSISRTNLHLLTAISVMSIPVAFALPTGGTIVSGAGTIQTLNNGQQVAVNQNSDKLIVNWDSFGIKQNEKVNFNQPNSNSVALNRIIGVEPSSILGQLTSNGKVFIINPNGVMFGAGSKINVGSLTVSTQNISNDDFNSGNNRFIGTSQASITNEGSINSDNGSVILMANKVINNGTINAANGSIALAAGSSFTVNPDGAGLVNVKIDAGAVDALVKNTNKLSANGGQVYLAAQDSSSIIKTVINNSGTIEANTLNLKAGKIVLDAGTKDMVNVSGSLTASAQGTNRGNGGLIEISGKNVRVESNAVFNTTADNGATGWLDIKADDLRVNYRESMSDSLIVSEALSRALNNSNVSLTSTNDNLTFDAPTSWSSKNKLELNAKNDVLILNDITATGANAALAFNTGSGSYFLDDWSAITLSGVGASFSLNNKAYSVIQNLTQLQRVNSDLHGLYVLGNNIDGGNRNFQSIASSIDPKIRFDGVLDGFGHTISKINIKASGPNAGLIASNIGEIRNINLASSTVTAGIPQYESAIGSLVGYNSGKLINSSNSIGMGSTKASSFTNSTGGLVGINTGLIDRGRNTGTVASYDNSHAIGGIVSTNNGGTITNSSNIATVTGSMADNIYFYSGAGGLVGVSNAGIIDQSSSSGTVSVYNSENTGGLIGLSMDSKISNSSSSGVTRSAPYDSANKRNIGGLVGLMYDGRIDNARTDVTIMGSKSSTVGGLVGVNVDGTIADSYATGLITNSSGFETGGLVGVNYGGLIKNSGAAALIYGGAKTSVGGLVGYNKEGTIQDSTAFKQTPSPSGKETIVFAGDNTNIGGAVGTNSGTLIRVTADTKVKGGNSSNTGGLVGINKGSINDSLSYSTVSSGFNSKLGKLVGINDRTGVIFNSQVYGNSGNGPQVTSGLFGINRGSVNNDLSATTTTP
jgi:filamentous hemagglutinin family protein